MLPLWGRTYLILNEDADATSDRVPRCVAIAAGTALRFAVAVMACVIAVGLLVACTVEPVDSPDVSATPTRTPTRVAAATTPPTATPEPSFKIANTDGDGVAVRDACDDGARVSAPGQGIPEETVVVLVAAGEGDCGEWMHVRASDGRESWVRSRYLDALPVERAPTQAQTSTAARDDLPVVITTGDGSKIYLENGRQAEIIMYYQEVRRYFAPSDHNLNGWRDATMLYQNSQVSDSDYYQYTRSAYDAHHNIARRWIDEGPRAPEGLSEASSYVSGVLQKRGDAMGHVALAIGTGDIEDVHDAEELLEQADAGIAAVVLIMLVAANEAGLTWDGLGYVVHCDEESAQCGLRVPKHGAPLLLSDCPHGTRASRVDDGILFCREAGE